MDKAAAKKHFNLDNSKPVLAVLGGSQGSIPLNRHFTSAYKDYTEKGFQVLWQCGKNDYENLKDRVNDDSVQLLPFTNDMSAFYSAADLMVSRAGALALSEMAVCGKAMILIPFPHAAGDHQVKNARSYEKLGAAKLISQEKLTTGALEKSAVSLIKNNHQLQEMAACSLKSAKPDAAEKIVEEIYKLVQN